MRLVTGFLMVVLAGSAFAQSDEAADTAAKREQCETSARLIGAVQQARLDRVRKSKAADKVLEDGAPWPGNVQAALPTVVEYVYSLSRKDLKAQNLGDITRTQCLQQYEQVQELTETGSN